MCSDIWKKNTPLDIAIECGQLEMAKFLFEEGGRPNLDAYRDGIFTPVHRAAWNGHTKTLKWIITENVIPSHVLMIKDHIGLTLLDNVMNHVYHKEWEAIARLLRRVIYLDPVFLAMQRAKRDYHQMCVLRRLPDELLDMVVDEVAVRFRLKVVW